MHMYRGMNLYQIRERGMSVRYVCGSNDISNVCAKVNDVSRIRVEAMLICLNIYLIQKQILSHDRLSSLLCITVHLFSVM